MFPFILFFLIYTFINKLFCSLFYGHLTMIPFFLSMKYQQNEIYVCNFTILMLLVVYVYASAKLKELVFHAINSDFILFQ